MIRRSVSHSLHALVLSLPLIAPTACGSSNGSGGNSDEPGDASAGAGGATSMSGGASSTSGGTSSTNGGSSSGGASAGGTSGAGGSMGPDAGAGGAVTWPSGPIRPTRYRVPDPAVVEPPCSLAGSGTIQSSEILLGQTHLTPAGWPFQTVSAARPLTIAVAAEGSGDAPAFTATARLDGRQLTICLSGPTALPADDTNLESGTYRGTFPAAWVEPGLQIDVSVAGAVTTVDVDVVAENGLTLYVVGARLFGEGTPDETTEAQWREFAARLPFSYLDVGENPFGVWEPEHLLVDARDDGRTPTGESTSHGILVATENPQCDDDDRAAGTCTPHSGFGTMSAVLGTLDTFREANGVAGISTWYATLATNLGGGLAGGQRGTGDDTGLTMNHELGHAWGFPHWDTDHTDYPYEGVQRNRGGFGDRWALDQVTGLLLSPLCNDVERQSPMQRAGSCVPDGSWFDPFSDYEAARLLRMALGAMDEVTGEVPYSGGVAGGTTRSFRLPDEGGRAAMVWNADGPGFSLQRYDEARNAFVDDSPDAWNRVAESEVPVVMFSGAVIVDGESFFEEPIAYVGNVLEALDPSDPDDYAYLFEHRSSDFYWARDLAFRFELDDGTVFYRLYGREAVLRASGDAARFAINLPEATGQRVVRLDVIARPLGHYSEESRLTDADSAATYFDEGRVVASWER